MENVFRFILYSGIVAIPFFSIIMIIRRFTRKISKIYVYVLWCFLMVELVVPPFIESPISFTGTVENYTDNEFISSYTYNKSDYSSNVFGLDSVENNELMGDSTVSEHHSAAVNSSSATNNVQTASTKESVNYTSIAWKVGRYLWIVGMLAFLGTYLLKYLKVRRQVWDAVRLDRRIWVSDKIESPFIMPGVISRIYMPYGVSEEAGRLMLEHEKSHIRHGDHIVRLIMNLILAVHWFNPVVWLAVKYMTQDMEMLCDETVLRKCTADEKAQYSRVLVDYSVKKSGLSPVIAFGESNTTKRVRHILLYKKPIIFISVAIIIISAVVITVFMSTSGNNQSEDKDIEETTTPVETESETAEPIDKVKTIELKDNDILVNLDADDEKEVIRTVYDDFNFTTYIYDSNGDELDQFTDSKNESYNCTYGIVNIDGIDYILEYTVTVSANQQYYKYSILDYSTGTRAELVHNSVTLVEDDNTDNEALVTSLKDFSEEINDYLVRAEVFLHKEQETVYTEDSLKDIKVLEEFELFGDSESALENAENFNINKLGLYFLKWYDFSENDLAQASVYDKEVYNNRNNYEEIYLYKAIEQNDFTVYLVCFPQEQYFFIEQDDSIKYINADLMSMHIVVPLFSSGDYDGDGAIEVALSGNVYTGTVCNGYNLIIMDDIQNGNYTLREINMSDYVTDNFQCSFDETRENMVVSFKNSSIGNIDISKINQESYSVLTPQMSNDFGPYYRLSDSKIEVKLIPVLLSDFHINIHDYFDEEKNMIIDLPYVVADLVIDEEGFELSNLHFESGEF